MSRDSERDDAAIRCAITRPDRSPVEYRTWRRCADCGRRPLGKNAYRCQRRTCPGYAETWARDTRRRLLDNLDAYNGRAVMVTLTAPGADVLPWDEEVCRHRGPHVHSGPDGCRVQGWAQDAWNETAPERARKLNRVAKLRADRGLDRRGISERRGKLAHGWEHQTRGPLHQHILLGMGTEAQDALGTNVNAIWSKLYGEALDELAPVYGFGIVHTRPLYEEPKPSRGAGAYLSGYFIGGRGKKAAITETVRSKTVPRLVVYVSAKLTAKTHCTMRNLRRTRRLFTWRSGVADKPPWPEPELLEVIALLDRALPQSVPRGP